MKYGRYAAIDIGTVTCRLLIADIDVSGLHEIKRGYGITNLGDGVDATGLLKPEAIERLINQVRQFQELIALHQDANHKNIKVVVVATSAARDAKNASVFLEALDSLGISLHIISGEKEAALSFAGVSYDFPDENLLVVDIGGGSTECSAGYSGGQPLLNQSFNVGCRRVTERFLKSNPPASEELLSARKWAHEVMKPYFERLAASGFSVERMVAVAGTATSVVSIHKKMQIYRASEVHRSVIEQKVLRDLYSEMKNMPLDQVKKIIGLDPGRAPVIVAGLLILDVVMELAQQKSFTASEADILQGIILDTATK